MKKKILSGISDVLSKTFAWANPNDENAEVIINWLIPQIDPEILRTSLIAYARSMMEENPDLERFYDPVPGLFAHFSELNRYERTVRTMGRRWWPYIEKWIADPQKVLAYMKNKNPKLVQPLSTALGEQYIVYFAKRMRTFFYQWFWDFPRWHNGCGGLIRFSLISYELNLWGWQCRRCGFVVPDEKIKEYTYQKRMHEEKRHV